MLRKILYYWKTLICALINTNEYEKNYSKYARGYIKYR